MKMMDEIKGLLFAGVGKIFFIMASLFLVTLLISTESTSKGRRVSGGSPSFNAIHVAFTHGTDTVTKKISKPEN